MNRLAEEFQQWAARSRERIGRAPLAPELERIGRVVQSGDGVARVEGLPDTRLDELLELERGVAAQAVDLDEAGVGCVLLGDASAVAAGSLVRGTGDVVRVPVGEALLGRVVDALGRPLDGGEPIALQTTAPVERPAPPIVDRALVDRPLATGLLVVDAAIPLEIGRASCRERV